MFTDSSVIVKAWVTMVIAGTYQYQDVPNVSNLREVVERKLTQAGYDTQNESA
ncbi:hypothetical protein [Halobacillus sp. BBL2006]|uniref:hypothetical protein n=1 Tax=Halobacillus sp. BBL2006 TaxID=1543706 RepID=UPI000A518D10|nr:hypothetical protein [Halobacillus sp. BBL2006]